MKIELIQPFIGSLDAVLGQLTGTPVSIADVTMEENGYRRKGLAAVVVFQGQIEGHVVLDVDPNVAAKVASSMTGGHSDPSEPIVAEAVCELANMVIGNAVTQLNDHGSHFKVLPPAILSDEQAVKLGRDTEATVLSFHTRAGDVRMNVSMHYLTRRFGERSPAMGSPAMVGK
jgi:chemotaxis protein CheX